MSTLIRGWNAAGDALVAGRGSQVNGDAAITTVNETTLIAAAGVGIAVDLSLLVFSNSSDTGTLVSLRKTTGGSVIHRFWVDGGALVPIPFPEPLEGSVNTNWTVQCSAAVSTLYAEAVGDKVRDSD